MLDPMAECGNVTSFARALGLDIGSTHVKAAVVCLDSGLRELAVAQLPIAGLGGRGLIDAALEAARQALEAAGSRVAVVGIASMAETGALVDADGAPGTLLRWDRADDAAARLDLARGIDRKALHSATGAPLVPKLPLLTWAALSREGIPHGARWAFAADLVAFALTGRISTDHTLAGRSGAYALPAPGMPVAKAWHRDLLDAAGVRRDLLPEVLLPGESAGAVRAGILPGATGAAVHIAGHDHAVAARVAGAGRPGRTVHSLGTTEVVVALAADGHEIDRVRAGREGISVVRAVDGVHEGVLAGSPAAGSLVASWRARAGRAADALLAEPHGAGAAIALPFPKGRQAPCPDPRASYLLLGGDRSDPATELTGILRGLAAHGAWMRAVVGELVGADASHEVSAVGAPVRENLRLAALMASLAGSPLPVVDLAAPVASGAAALAAERAGLAPSASTPFRYVEPHDDGMPDLAERFARAVRATTTVTQGAP